MQALPPAFFVFCSHSLDYSGNISLILYPSAIRRPGPETIFDRDKAAVHADCLDCRWRIPARETFNAHAQSAASRRDRPAAMPRTARPERGRGRQRPRRHSQDPVSPRQRMHRHFGDMVVPMSKAFGSSPHSRRTGQSLLLCEDSGLDSRLTPSEGFAGLSDQRVGGPLSHDSLQLESRGMERRYGSRPCSSRADRYRIVSRGVV